MLLAIFLTIFSAIALHNLRYGVYLVIFFAPIYLWRFSVLGIPSTALEAMIYILFFVWLFRNYRGVSYSNIKKQLSDFIKAERILILGIFLLMAGAVISTLFSSDLETSTGILKGWFFDPFLFFLVFISTIRTKYQIISSLSAWFFSGAAVSIISIFYLLSGDLTFDGRLKEFFLSPNHLAMYISIPFLIALGFLINKARFDVCNVNEKLEIGNWKFGSLGLERLLNNMFQVSSFKFQVIVLIIILIPLYSTRSYGAFLGIFAGIIYLLLAGSKYNAFLPLPNALFFLRGFSRRLRSFSFTNFQDALRLKPLNPQLKLGRIQNPIPKLPMIILLFLVFTSFIFITLNKSNQIISSDNRSSFHSRLIIWSTAAEIIKDSPLFGIGPGTFQDAYLSYTGRFSEPYLEWAVPQPHNIFLAFYLQTGLVGFIGFILILVWFFHPASKYKNNNVQYPCLSSKQAIISNILVSLMIYTLIHGLVDTTYWKNDLALMFWILIAIAFACRKNKVRRVSH